jgi:hypothetical protein
VYFDFATVVDIFATRTGNANPNHRR